MRWLGYVSRDFLASAEARAKAEHENAQALRHALVREEVRADQERAERIAALEQADRRYLDLLSRYHMLKLQGAVELQPPTPMKIITPDPVMKAISEKALDERTRKAMLAQVSRDRQAGLKDEEIVQRIYAGNRPAEEVA